MLLQAKTQSIIEQDNNKKERKKKHTHTESGLSHVNLVIPNDFVRFGTVEWMPSIEAIDAEDRERAANRDDTCVRFALCVYILFVFQLLDKFAFAILEFKTAFKSILKDCILAKDLR